MINKYKTFYKKLLSAFLLFSSLSLAISFALGGVSNSSNTNLSVLSPDKIGCFMFASNLKYGDGIKNVDLKLVKFGQDSQLYKVIELQNILSEAGYLNLGTMGATGYFGINTFKAVKKYQKANNISPTGFVGEKTRGVLRSQFCSVANATTTPMVCDYAAPPTSCYYVQGQNYSSTTQCGMELVCDQPKIKDCPTEKIINYMPVMCIRAPCPAIDNSYYIYNGVRKEISDFDTNYVKNYCSVKETRVY